MSDLYISYPNLEAPPVSGIYALLFDPRAATALDFSATGLITLQPFDGDQNRFALDLVLDPVRPRYYRETVVDGTFTLPTIPEGEVYEVEFWEQLGGLPDRSNDRFLNVREVMWVDGKIYEDRIDSVQIDEIRDAVLTYVMQQASGSIQTLLGALNRLPTEPAGARYEAFCTLSYDTDNERFGIEIWLERDGALVEDAQQAYCELRDSTDVLVFTKTLTVRATNGNFAGQVLGIVPNPDESYFLKARVLDARGVQHSTGHGPVTWD